eukprot:5210034-Pyramimonas_sp.AAC.1
MGSCLALAEWGGPEFTSLFVLVAVTRMRAEISTRATCRRRLGRLEAVVRDMGSAGLWCASKMAPEVWGSDPFAGFLEQAGCEWVLT